MFGFPDSGSLTQFWGHLAMMFGSRRKHTKAIHTTSVSVTSEEIGGIQNNICPTIPQASKQDQCPSHPDSVVKSELNKVLKENQKLRNLFNPDKMVETMTKVVSTMTMKAS